jgi:hydroxyacylglutathione hydrolase
MLALVVYDFGSYTHDCRMSLPATMNLGDAFLHLLPILADNYCYVLERNGRAWVVDPGDASPVLHLLQERGLHLSGIMCTHAHGDHTAGNGALIARMRTPLVMGPTGAPIPGLTRGLREGDVVECAEISFRVIATPGHTRHDLSFFGEDHGLLFCGDTLFSGGCGRLFDGDAATMWASLCKLAALPDATKVFCGHEYTLSNLEFANALLPHVPGIEERLMTVRGLRDSGLPSIPSTLAVEHASNLFLMAGLPRIRAALGLPPGLADHEVFAHIRQLKDHA